MLFHGGGQNAHTWDVVAVALARPLLCVDLPGHGRSAWRPDHDYRPRSLVTDVADVVSELAPSAHLVGGMSLGGMTALALAAARPELVPRLAVIDVAPGSGKGPGAEALFEFTNGPYSFATLEEMVDRALVFSPGRSRQALRLGVLHNAFEDSDGRWRWRYDPVIGRAPHVADVREEFRSMWDEIAAIGAPTLLLKGGDSPSVSEGAVLEWRRRQPHVRVVVVEGAGHAVQSDRPIELAGVLDSFLATDLSAPVDGPT